MRPRRRALRASLRRAWVGGVLFLAPLLAHTAHAEPTKDQCVDANAKAQDLRREGKLSLARDQLRLCAEQACPAIVRSDCTKRLDALENAQPTIAFEVKSASGLDLADVHVAMDGKPLASRLGGSPFAADPGEHVFTFEVAGEAAVTRTVVLVEGEKGRRERIVVGAAGAPPATQPAAAPSVTQPAPATTPGASKDAGGTQRAVGLVAGGAGIVGLGVGAIFGALALGQEHQQQTDCASASSCTSAGHALALNDHATGMTDSTVSTVGFIAGGALFVGGAVLLLTAGSGSAKAPSTGMRLAPTVGPGGGGMLVTGEF